jgi:hypothetical protein
MVIARIAPILLLCVLLVSVVACNGGGETAAVPTLGPPGCAPDRDATGAAIDAYHARYGDWPTASGEPGDMDWDKLVPEFLPYKPGTDSKCQWGVNGDPEGEICLQNRC